MWRARPPIDTLAVGDLVFSVRWSDRRRTIGLSVARDGSLRIAAPAGTSTRRLTQAVRAKTPWVRRKLAQFAALGPPPAPKQLAAGERLSYLGRTHPLVLVDAAQTPVALRRGRFELASSLGEEARDALVAWYCRRAEARLADRVAHFAPVVGAAPHSVTVRDLGGRRWGTCHTRRRALTFHWALIMQPPALIDYVVVHELAHLHEANHGSGFWRHVERVLPDWKARRAALATLGERHRL